MAVDERELALLSRSPRATEALAESLGRLIDSGCVIALSGELGSGKTCFTRGLARGLGIESDVTSPTFALMAAHAGRMALYHFDAWMEGREKALFLDGGDEWLHRGGVAVVEWAERVAAFLPRPYLSVRLEHRGANERSIHIAVQGMPAGEWERWLAQLRLPAGVHALSATEEARTSEPDARPGVGRSG